MLLLRFAWPHGDPIRDWGRQLCPLNEYLCASISYEGVSNPDTLAALIRVRGLSQFSILFGGFIRKAHASALLRRPESVDAIQHRLYRETNFDPCKALSLNWECTGLDREAISRIAKGRGGIVEKKEDLVPLFDCTR